MSPDKVRRTFVVYDQGTFILDVSRTPTDLELPKSSPQLAQNQYLAAGFQRTIAKEEWNCALFVHSSKLKILQFCKFIP